MKRLFAFIPVFLLIGCGAGSTASDPRTFDLGLAAPSAVLPAVRVGTVRAVAPFETTDMHYRLAWRNASEIAAFASSRWAAAPAELFRKQLLRAAGEGSGKCALGIEIQEFTQVFASTAESAARIELRIALAAGSTALSKHITVIEGNAGPDAVTGAAAFARAADRAIVALGAWVAAQTECR